MELFYANPCSLDRTFSDYIENHLKNEAAKLFRIHQLPDIIGSWQKHRNKLLENIWKNLGVCYDNAPFNL